MTGQSKFRGVRAALAAGRVSAGITYRRAANRVFDVAGWAAGYCMATTWQQERATYAPGYRHWRCWVKRSQHAGPHRTGSYRWADGGRPIYDPLGINLLRSDPAPGTAPGWARGRHKDVGTRRRDRLEARTARELARQVDAQRARWGIGAAVLDQMRGMYYGTEPSLRRWPGLRWFMNRRTLDGLARSVVLFRGGPGPDRAFGVLVEVDDNMPDGTVMLADHLGRPVGDRDTLWPGELGVMPFTGRPADDNDEQDERQNHG